MRYGYRTMTFADWRRLLFLAALWGGSFIFIRVVAPVLGPLMTVEARVLIAGVTLFLYARAIKARMDVRTWWPQYLVIGALNSAIPFALIAAAEMHITASMAAILNATSPLFGAVISALWLKERLTPVKVIGIAVAVAGVAVLVGWSPITYNTVTLLSIGASLTASLLYGLAGAYTKAKAKGVPPLGMAVCSQLAASLLIAPVLPFAWPAAHPSPAVIACMLMLGLLSTGLAFVLYFRLIADVGATKALTVTFLAPIFGVLWSALFLGEPVTLIKALACGIILLGTAAVTGTAFCVPEGRKAS